MLGDQLDRLVVDQRVDDLVQRLVDDVPDLLDVPTGAHRGQVVAHPIHLILVGAGQREHELGVRAAQHGPSIDQAALVERLAERKRGRLRDDGLVESKNAAELATQREYRLRPVPAGVYPQGCPLSTVLARIGFPAA